MAKSNVSFEYENGPDWKPGLRGQRFKPRISRALDQFIERAENHKPNLIPAISRIDLSKSNPWVTLIAQALWARLAPETGVALPETDITPANLWPTSTRKGTTLDGREYWVRESRTTDYISFRLMGGSSLNPTEIQEIGIPPKTVTLFLAVKRGYKGYPSFSALGVRDGVYALHDWGIFLELIHLYGKKLSLGGDDQIFLGANPLNLSTIRDVQHKIRADLYDKQGGRPPRFFMGAIRPGQPPTHKSTSDLIHALIGWEIAALAVESIQADSVPRASESLSEYNLTLLTKILNQMDPYLHTRNRDKYLPDLEEALDEIDQMVQNKQIPAEIADRILATRRAIGAPTQTTPSKTQMEAPRAEQEPRLEAEWLRIMKEDVGPLYPQMTFLGTEIDRDGARPQINVLYRGSDTAARKVGKQVQQEWDDRKWKAATALSESVNWAYTFNLRSRQ